MTKLIVKGIIKVYYVLGRLFGMARKQITLVDIANVCGTSKVTVSKALAGKGGVSNELRKKIFETAEEMGYVPVKSSNSFVDSIGVLIPEKFINPNGSFYWALYNNLVQRLKLENISCIQENLTSEEEASLVLPKLLTGRRITALISLGQLSSEYVEKLREAVDVLILLDYYIPEAEVDCIVTNGFFGGYKLTNHLISKGHTKIGYVGTRLATTSIFDRYMGYMKSMIEHGLAVDEKWLIDDRTIDNELFEKIDFPDELPTAFVCNCDETAFKVIRDLKLRGYSVPADISVVGYDNYLISEISDPPITTINVDSKEMAELAVVALKERIKNPKIPPRTQFLTGKLVVKASVKEI